MNTCPHCGKETPPGDTYCPECIRVRNVRGNTEEIRIPYIYFCPHCGGKVTPATVYCPACGKDVGVFPEAEPPVMEQNAFNGTEDAGAWILKAIIIYTLISILGIPILAILFMIFGRFFYRFTRHIVPT